MSSHPAIQRLAAELRDIQLHPEPNYTAGPISDDNMLVWHFSIRGPSDTPFEGGIYHGEITFPINYPYSPPDVTFFTPNGRFETHTKICLNSTSYHQEEWKPSWGVGVLLTALIAFLPTPGENAIGAIEMSDEDRRRLARQSVSWSCPNCQISFPDVILPQEVENSNTEETPPEPIEDGETTPTNDELLTDKEEVNVKIFDEDEEEVVHRTVEIKFRPDIDLFIIMIIIATLVILADSVFDLARYFS